MWRNCVDNSDGTVSVDMMCYEEPGYDGLTLDQPRAGQSLGTKFEDGGQLQRWVVDPVNNTSTMSVLYDGLCELPTINYAKNTQTYDYVYGVGSPAMQQTLVKVNASTGQTQVWGENGCVVGEPIYVPLPGAVAEDDGVVLSVVFDTLSQRNCLLVLDGQTSRGFQTLTSLSAVPVTSPPSNISSPRGRHNMQC
jgi:carotenoid cleavage dioxygenase-like enzyme